MCIRDSRYSAGLFPELPQVRYAPDVVFNYHAAAVQKQKHQVLFSVIDMKNRHGKWGISQYDMAYKRFIARLADGYLEREMCIRDRPYNEKSIGKGAVSWKRIF